MYTLSEKGMAMDGEMATRTLEGLADEESGEWLDPRHIATDTFRGHAIERLCADPMLKDVADAAIALVEIWLRDDVPNIQEFSGIFAVNEYGIWFYDGDGSIDDPPWRQYLIPWQAVASVCLHQHS